MTEKNLPVELKNVTLIRDGNVVLENVDFQVREGLSYAIIGPNGGGKTSFIKAILGLIKPASGTITIYGKSPEKNRRLIGYVPQFHTFDFRYPITVREMVLSGRLGHINGIIKRYSEEDITAAEESMKLLGIEKLAERTIGELSGGEQQRAIIARAIAGRPKILIMDEPTVYVDSPTEEKLHEIISGLSKDMTIIMITHDIGAISSGIDVIACLNRKIYTHYTNEITADMVQNAYKCPVELIAHGLAHRVLDTHESMDAEASWGGSSD